jgi:TRAP-type C4-dicarboxylate transport system permease large subunit
MLPLPGEIFMGFIVGGMLLLVIAAVLEALWDFGRHVKQELRPAFLQSNWRHVILAGCILLLLVGGVLLFVADVRVGLGAIVVYFLVLPFVVGSRVRRHFLPPWDDLKVELTKQGYTEQTYWRRGDWWKATSENKPRAKSNSKSRE